MSSVTATIQKFANEMIRLTGEQPSAMVLPSRLYRMFEQEAYIAVRCPNANRGAEELTLNTGKGPIVFTKKCCSKCGQDV